MMMPWIDHYHLLAIFVAFGVVCGFYVSVVGFVLTALFVIVLVALAGAVVTSPFTVGTLILAYVLMQVGYFVTVIGCGLGAHVLRLQASRAPGSAKAEFNAEQDRPR